MRPDSGSRLRLSATCLVVVGYAGSARAEGLDALAPHGPWLAAGFALGVAVGAAVALLRRRKPPVDNQVPPEAEPSAYRSMLDALPDALVAVDEGGAIQFFNPAAERLLGYRGGELLGRNFSRLLPEPYRRRLSRSAARFLRLYGGRLLNQPREVIAYRGDGSVAELELTVNRLQREGRCWFIGVLRDLSARRERDDEANEWLFGDLLREMKQQHEVERELTRLAETDRLTGVYNRHALEERLAQCVYEARSRGRPFALAMLDVDHFKRINDTHGHPAGDAVLKQTAAVVANSLRDGDVLVRWGGEEFVILAPGTDLEGIIRVAERIRAAIERQRFADVGCVTASFGVAEYRAGEEAKALFARLDAALYAAKQGGRNQVCSAA